MRLMIAATVCAAALCCAAAETKKPVLLYSRYFNAKGEARYLADGNYKEFLQQLSNEFDVRVNSNPLDADTLRDVNVLLIANPSDNAAGNNPPPHHVDENDVRHLTAYVQRGGGLVVMGNQENHNLEVNDMNKLLKQFGLGMTNVYTDAKLLPLPKSTPVIGGLRWAYYTGNSVAIEVRHPAKPRALVNNDLNITPAAGNRNHAGALMAVAEPERGRVLVVTDSGWLTDAVLNNHGIGGVVLKPHDNYEIFRRLAHWLAGK